MQQIKDIKNNTICLLNKDTGQVQMKYKGLTTEFIIPIGSFIKVERNHTITYIHHTNKDEYEINYE